MSSVVKEVYKIPLSQLEANEWNPNEQSDETFNELVKEIQEIGFCDPIHVVPDTVKSPDWKTLFAEGKHAEVFYKIIGGEHRWKACKVLDISPVPAFIHEDWDEVKQKLKTVRQNLLRGHLNDVKFTKLVNDLRTHIDIDENSMASLMGFETEAEFARHYLKEKEAKEKSFVEGLMDETLREKYAGLS